MGSTGDLRSATAMLEALRRRHVSARELLALHLDRIARINPRLNAVVASRSEDAEEAAGAADRARARGEERPLLGLPVTIKDSVQVRGLPTTYGLPEWAGHVATADAPAVAKLRAAGAVILGKTNMSPGGAECHADNPVYGRTNNPWDVERTPGGSSGGSAAAVAAGLSPLDLAGDFGGSIRVPAAFCGVFGHRPSDGIAPATGTGPVGRLPSRTRLFAVLGPIARSAEDLALMLSVIAGPDEDETVAWRLDLPAARHEGLAAFRVLVLPELPWLPLDETVAAPFTTLADALGGAGARVARTTPAPLGDLRELMALRVRLGMATFYREELAGRSEAERRTVADEMVDGGDPFADARRAGLMGGAAEYVAWLAERDRYRAAFREVFRAYDVVLTPATNVPAYRHDSDIPAARRALVINGRATPYGTQWFHSHFATLTGQPATVFPIGVVAGLPVAAQAIGPYLEDHTPVRFAALASELVGGFREPPELVHGERTDAR